MVTIVVAINVILSAFLCYLAQRIWRIRRQLARTADTLIALERCSRSILHDAPEIIYCGQDRIYRLRQSGESVQLQLQQLRQALLLSVIGWRTWVRIRNSKVRTRN